MTSLSNESKDRVRRVVHSKCRKLTLWHSRTFLPILTHDHLEPIMATIGFFPIIPGIPKRKQQTEEPAAEDNDNVNEELGENAKEGRVAAAGTEPETVAVTGTEQENVPASVAEEVQWREYELKSITPLTGANLDLESRPWPRLPYPRLDGLHLASYLAFLAALESYVNPYVVVNLFLIRPMKMRNPGPRSIYKYTTNMNIDQELDVGTIYFYRESTFNGISEEEYDRLRASVGNISCNELSMNLVRKDRRRQIEVDERDDSSDFVCLTKKVRKVTFRWK